MLSRDAMTRSVKATAERPQVVCCAQCGEVLDLERVRKLAAKVEPQMCRDCAFEMPCTD
jgi:predicted nucleic acid-binding Zn ribbon protein